MPRKKADAQDLLGRAYGSRTVCLRAKVVAVSPTRKGMPHGRLELEMPVEGPEGPSLARLVFPVESEVLSRFEVGEAIYVEVRRPER